MDPGRDQGEEWLKAAGIITGDKKEYAAWAYDVFPGLQIMKLHYRMPGFVERREKCNKLEINFCINGRFECEFTDRDVGILKAGDMAVSMFDGENGRETYTEFPLGFYDGICIMVDCDISTGWMQKNLGVLAVDMNRLKKKLLPDHWYRAGKAGFRCEHVFRELYDDIEREEQTFVQLKAAELLMLLEKLPKPGEKTAYYPKGQIELVKHIRDHILTDSASYGTVEQLAKKHGLSAAQLQKLFREVYGMPIYRYLKEYRLEQAAVDLVSTAKSVMEIADEAGFSNASKFSEGFKKRYGLTPTAYRNAEKLNRHNDPSCN